MENRKIADRNVGALGLGCMGMSWAYGTADKDEALRTLDRALELGVDFWDTADVYGAGDNEKLLAGSLKGRRDRVFLATKFGNVYDRSMTSHQDLVQQDKGWIVDGTPAYVRKCAELSLSRLGTDAIDLYYQHRVDPRVPIEETVGEMVRLKEEGKIRHLGLSEASAETVRRAHKVHPIAAVQSEYSLWTRDFEADVIPTCQELGITFVPYSPLGRGFLTGTITKPEDLEENDWRRQSPRFQPENLERNSALAARVKAVADELLCTPAQVALAWVLAKGPDMVPIPGTKRVRYLEDNVGATKVTLSPHHIEALDGFETSGARYAPMGMEYVNG
ncbi:MAG: aldo/keto reductase [Armatimonadetes bacterium]|nr:aldo/keto reductase [Armatimonadota bacterium]